MIHMTHISTACQVACTHQNHRSLCHSLCSVWHAPDLMRCRRDQEWLDSWNCQPRRQDLSQSFQKSAKKGWLSPQAGVLPHQGAPHCTQQPAHMGEEVGTRECLILPSPQTPVPPASTPHWIKGLWNFSRTINGGWNPDEVWELWKIEASRFGR